MITLVMTIGVTDQVVLLVLYFLRVRMNYLLMIGAFQGNLGLIN